MAVIGIIMELAGRSAGRALALSMLGLQALIACGVAVFVIYMTFSTESTDDNLTAGDLPTLSLLLVPPAFSCGTIWVDSRPPFLRLRPTRPKLEVPEQSA